MCFDLYQRGPPSRHPPCDAISGSNAREFHTKKFRHLLSFTKPSQTADILKITGENSACSPPDIPPDISPVLRLSSFDTRNPHFAGR
jgi:hypothetical protein